MATHRLHWIPEPRRSLYRWTFLVAAIYNLVWGISVILFPTLGFWMLSIPTDQIGELGMVFWRCIGMFVMVFAIGYWYSSREPERYAAFILIGTLGKVFGPIGFVVGWYQGIVPGRVGWTILTNDLLWWPIFFAFVYETIVQRRLRAEINCVEVNDMKVAFQTSLIVLLALVGAGIVVLVNAPKWFDARPVPTTSPAEK